jgi:hypothetical protein
VIPLPATRTVWIREIFPAPEPGQREWIKVQAGDQHVQLADWQIDDGTGGGSAHTITGSMVIEPFEIAMIELPRALLNNGGDRVMLIDPAGTIVDLAEYGNIPAGTSACFGVDGGSSACQPDHHNPASPTATPDAAATPGSLHATAGHASATVAPTPRRPRWLPGHPDGAVVYALPTTPATVTPTTPATVTPTTPATVTPTIPATVTPTIPATVTPTIPATVTPTTPATGASPSAMLGGGIACIGVIMCGYGLMRRRAAVSP